MSIKMIYKYLMGNENIVARTYRWFEGLGVPEFSDIQCYAPMCENRAIISKKDAIESKINNGCIRGLCPSCLERITAGRISDGNPTTNPDLENTNE